MKKYITILFLIVSCAFAQNETGTSNDIPNEHTHNRFFFSFNMGPTRTYLRQTFHNKLRDGNEYENGKFTAVLLYEEIRLGWSFYNTASFYGAIGFSHGKGTYQDETIKISSDPRHIYFEEDDDESYRFLFGIGGEYYPIQNQDNPFYGLFVGLTFGLMLDNVAFTDFSYDEIYIGETVTTMFANFYGRLEIGKEWWFSDHWSIGFALNYAYGFYDGKNRSKVKNEEGNYYMDKESHVNHSVGLALRLAY